MLPSLRRYLWKPLLHEVIGSMTPLRTCPSFWAPTRKSLMENQPSTTLRPSTTVLQPARPLPSLPASALAQTWSVLETVARFVPEKPPCVAVFTRRRNPFFSWSRTKLDLPKQPATSLGWMWSLLETSRLKTLHLAAMSVG